MKAIVLNSAGGVKNLITKEIEQPKINNKEVLVKVKAISINPADFKVRSTEEGLSWLYGTQRPVILGWDISGTVEKIGDNVTEYSIGDKVFGMINFPGHGNAYAEYVAAPESQLAKVPSNISFEDAAATTLAALTALQVLETSIKKGDRVLIHAGSGGVGHYAVQIAKSLGAFVITTSSAKNKEFLVSFGADEHIDYRTQDIEKVTSNLDFVLDSVGGETLLKSLNIVNKGGSIITLLASELTDDILELAKNKGINIAALLVKSSGKDMNTLKEMLENGLIKPHISKTFSFNNMDQAHLHLESGRTVGKVVVTL